MGTKVFYSLKEIQQYYDEEFKIYVFKEKGYYIDLVVFNFYLDIKADIDCWNINAMNIKAWNIRANNIIAWNINAMNIKAWDIRVLNINAKNISYFAVCVAYENIKCKSIKGRRKNAKHFVLDGKLEVIDDE